jgi:hypothetical protein
MDITPNPAKPRSVRYGKCGEFHGTQNRKRTTIKCCQCNGPHEAWHHKCLTKLMKWKILRELRHQLPYKFIMPRRAPQEAEEEQRKRLLESAIPNHYSQAHQASVTWCQALASLYPFNQGHQANPKLRANSFPNANPLLPQDLQVDTISWRTCGYRAEILLEDRNVGLMKLLDRS